MARDLFGVDLGDTLYQEMLAVGGGENFQLVQRVQSMPRAGYAPSTYGDPKPAETITNCYGTASTDLNRFEGTVLEDAEAVFSIFRASLGNVEPSVGDIIRWGQRGDFTILSSGLDDWESTFSIQARR